MKNRLLCMLLSFALLFTTAFAGTSAVFADEVDEPQMEEVISKPMDFNSVDWEDEDEVYDAVLENIVYFDCTVEQKVEVKKAGYYTHFVDVFVEEAGCEVEIELLDSKGTVIATADTEPIPVDLIDEETGLYYCGTWFENVISKSGTYSIRITTLSGEPAIGTYYGVYYPRTSKSSPISLSGKGDMVIANNSSNYSWFKITLPKTGYIKVTMGDSISTNKLDKYSVRLYNADKSKCLSGGNQTLSLDNDYTTYFGAKKGTYYIRVYNKDVEYFTIKAGRNYVDENSGSSKSTAKRMYKDGAAKKGIVNATQSSTYGDYYYFKLTKKQKVKFSISSKSGGYSGGLKVTLYKKGSSDAIDTVYLPKGYCKDTVTFENGEGSQYLTSGTYYVKVSKWKTGSGYYYLRWL